MLFLCEIKKETSYLIDNGVRDNIHWHLESPESVAGMERAGLKTLNTVVSPLHFRAKASIFRPLLLPQVVHNLHFPLLSSSSRLSPLRSLCMFIPLFSDLG